MSLFIFVFIRYFIGAILSKKWGMTIIGDLIFKRDVHFYWHEMILKHFPMKSAKVCQPLSKFGIFTKYTKSFVSWTHNSVLILSYNFAVLNISTGHRTMSGKKIELCLTKAASQWTQLSDVKLKKIHKLRTY